MAFTLQKLNLLQELSYRRPMLVRELVVFPNTRPIASYYVCPRCQITIEREFMRYCDRCGQYLDWRMYEQATIVYPGKKKRGAGAYRPDPSVKSLVQSLLNVLR